MRLIILVTAALLSALSFQTFAQNEKSYTDDFSIAEKTFLNGENRDIEWTHSGGVIIAERYVKDLCYTNLTKLDILKDAKTFDISFDVRIDKGAANQSAGIVVSTINDYDESIFFGVCSNGSYYVNDDNYDDLRINGNCYSADSIHKQGSWNTLRIVFDGMYQKCFINDEVVDIVDMNAYMEGDDLNSNGTIGFYLDEGVTKVTFDNLKIKTDGDYSLIGRVYNNHPNFRYSCDFSEETEDKYTSHSNYDSNRETTCRWKVSDGVYKCYGYNEDYSYNDIRKPCIIVSRFFLSMDVKIVEGDDAAPAGIIFEEFDLDNVKPSMRFGINGNSNFAIGEYFNQDWDMDYIESPYIDDIGSWNSLSILCDGTNFKYYINGILVHVKTKTIDVEYVGMWSGSGKLKEVWFDNLIIQSY